MSKELKISIQDLAKKVIEMNGVADASDLQEIAKELYDKVTILKYLEENPINNSIVADNNSFVSEEEETQMVDENVFEPIHQNGTEEPSKVDEVKEVEESLDEPQLLSTLDENLFVSDEPMDESLLERATEKIKDIVAQMPPEADKIEEFIQEVVAPPVLEKNDMVEVTPNQEDLFATDKPQSLNDRLKKSITIGLNDRIAFVKHLFNGSTEDFNRVISQLNTLTSELEALEFLNNMVKPEYNQWEGKEDYEQRFLSFIEGKYA